MTVPQVISSLQVFWLKFCIHFSFLHPCFMSLASYRPWFQTIIMFLNVKSQVVTVLFELSTTLWRHIGRVEIQLYAFFDVSTKWRWVVRFTSRPFCPQGKSPRYPMDRRLCGPQSWSGRGIEEKNSSTGRESNPYHPIIQPVASCYTDWAIPAH
jgi:hypothetical protein